jgi:hypothetical protein
MMKASATSNASVEATNKGWMLRIPKGDSSRYRLAQLDDYSQLPRHKFPHRSLTFSLRARASSDSIPGTWGFGLWNDPFGLSLGFGGNPFRLPVLPNAAWFFSASQQNHLSFQEDKPAHGFLAQTFCSPRFHPALIPAGLALPFSRKATRKVLGRVIDEDAIALNVDVTRWHEYSLDWSPKRVFFEVDHMRVLESPVSPRAPLGVIIWLDNQYAAFRPNGKIEWGVLDGKECWLEVGDIEILERE